MLFTDMVMPEGMSGIELADILRNENRGLGVVIFTGYSNELGSESMNDARGLSVLRKPVEARSLLAAVRACLDAHPRLGPSQVSGLGPGLGPEHT